MEAEASSIRRLRARLPLGRGAGSQPRGWSAAVAVSAAIVAVVALAAGVGWLASAHSRTSTYSYTGELQRVQLRLSSGDAVIVGSSGSSVEVRRTDSYAFGHAARERRTLSGGVLSIASSCPRIIVGACSASYEIAVPETVAVDVQTARGSVRLEGFRGSAEVRTRSGDVDAEAYCGFDLSATSDRGNLRVSAACAPENLRLSTGSGDALALVPPGRYRIDARGVSTSVRGLVRDASAPFALAVHSAHGAVTVGGGL